MKLSRLLLSTSLTAGLALAPHASAVAWNANATVKASDYNPAVPGGTSVLVVAAGETVQITDIVITHNVTSTTSTFRANLRRGPASNIVPCATASPVLTPYVSPLQTVSLHLTSPIELQAGEQLCVVVGGASGSDGITLNLVGVKLP